MPNDDIDPNQRFFFAHIMKTGGSTFRSHLKRNFRKPQIFPLRGQVRDLERCYMYVDAVRELTEADHARYRAYAGHHPPVVAELIGPDVITMSLIREPVARTISVLKHARRHIDRYADLAYEEIYEDPWVHDLSVLNHQSKLFAMTLDDKLESCLDALIVDDQRLSMAIDRMRSIEVLGLQSHYDQFLVDLAERYRWVFKGIDNREVSGQHWKPPASFIRHIREDNAADVAFYDAAVVHFEKTHAARPIHSIPKVSPLRSAASAAKRGDVTGAVRHTRQGVSEGLRSAASTVRRTISRVQEKH